MVRAARRHLPSLAAVGLAVLLVGGTVPPDDPPRSPFPGFLLDGEEVTTIEVADPAVQVFPTSINNHGVTVGEYIRPNAASESGLRRDPDGTIDTFDIPGAAGTEATDINDHGVISGSFSEDTPIVNNSARTRGFLLAGDDVTTVDVDGAVGTGVNSVNDRGQAIGVYIDSAGASHGFCWENGHITPLDIPGAANTVLTDIDNRGRILGITMDAAGTSARGFLWEDGRLTDISVPGVALTLPQRINERGQIVGYTADDLELTGARGFLLASGVDGPVTPVEVPGAPRTAPSGLNDRGQIVGLYENPNPL